MVAGTLAGVAVFYELVSLAHRSQLTAKLHSPDNVWLGTACVFIFGWGVGLMAFRVARWFGMFTAVGGWAAGAIAASGNESAYAVPLLCLGLAGALVVLASHRSENQRGRALTA